MTQRDLADSVGVQQATISQWERGTRSPHFTKIMAIAAALGIPGEELLPRLPGETTMTLGEHRQLVGLSQRALAARLQVNPNSLAGIERGLYWPEASIAPWAAELGITACEFRKAWWHSRQSYST